MSDSDNETSPLALVDYRIAHKPSSTLIINSALDSTGQIDSPFFQGSSGVFQEAS